MCDVWDVIVTVIKFETVTNPLKYFKLLLFTLVHSIKHIIINSNTLSMDDRPNSALLRKQIKTHRRVSTQVNNSGLISPHSLHIETLSPVTSSRRNNLFRDRTSERYGSRGPLDIDRKPSTTSHYRIRKIGPKLIGGE